MKDTIDRLALVEERDGVLAGSGGGEFDDELVGALAVHGGARDLLTL